MKTPTIDKNAIRDELKAKRNRLFDEYSKNPKNTRLALEIRLIDDLVANLAEHPVQQTKSGQE
jgi:hypothetical protein